ncbi:MAG: GGDEF domain-containing protein [Chloroflexi bacterium]|nr:GGDEF domain-containing protein [Chloroflexota bacterium]
MQAVRPETRAVTDHDMARDEAGINRAVWASRGILLFLTAAVVAFFVAMEAERSWQYAAYPLLAGLPLLYGIVSARYIRLMHVELLRRYQARLVIRTAELQEMASRDELTQLYNRRHFYQFLQSELEKTRVSKGPLALLLLDVDGLKGINDEYGHRVGDTVIANLGKVIAKHVRTSDIAARLGGDEFGVVMPDTDKRGAFSLAQRLWEELGRTPLFEEDGRRVMVSVSIGVSGFPWGGEDVDEMMHWADADMYANKASRYLPAERVSADVSRESSSPLDDYGGEL